MYMSLDMYNVEIKVLHAANTDSSVLVYTDLNLRLIIANIIHVSYFKI